MHREAEESLPALIAALHIERPLLVGHSDGGSIALIFAGAFPEVPLGIAVLAPHEFVEEVTLVGIRAARSIWESTDWPNEAGPLPSGCGSRVFSEWNDTWLSPLFRDWNIEQYLPKIRCPVLAIQGEDDEYATMRQIEVIAEQVPGTNCSSCLTAATRRSAIRKRRYWRRCWLSSIELTERDPDGSSV
jgi:pimeloyl-ACP methyl ester carboxylesterase